MKRKNKNISKRNRSSNHPRHNLIPTRPLDLSRAKTIDNLLGQMSQTSFGARSLGEAASVLHKMVRDRDCFIVLTISGAMTIAKMGLVICDMIEHGMANAIVSTGAIITHGFIEATGLYHFKTSPEVDDKKLYHAGYDRVYDTLELEKNFDHIDRILIKTLKSIPNEKILSSVFINEILGKYLSKNVRKKSLLKSAYEKGVPIYVPAFTDSELGMDLSVFNKKAILEGRRPFSFDPFIDLGHFSELIKKQKKIGIFTVGGGVPRNWAQQICPYFDILRKRLNCKITRKRYMYGVRICPEPAHWGGLSGCTYKECISWGKLTPPSEGGRWAEVYADATIAWPLIVKAVMERLKKHHGK